MGLLTRNNITFNALMDWLAGDQSRQSSTLCQHVCIAWRHLLCRDPADADNVPLRVANMAGSTFFAVFGALSGNVRPFLLYLLSLPINALRLRQMLDLIKKGARRWPRATCRWNG